MQTRTVSWSPSMCSMQLSFSMRVHFLKSPCTVHFQVPYTSLHIFQLSLSWCTFHHFPQSYPFRKASHWVAAGAEAAAKTFRSLTRLEGPNEACEIQRVASGYHRGSAPLKVPFIEEEAPLSPSPLGGELWLGIQWFKYIYIYILCADFIVWMQQHIPFHTLFKFWSFFFFVSWY